MPSTSFPVGVAAVLLPTVGASALPAFTSLTFTASAVASVGDSQNNGGRSNLDPSATYQVILAPLGVDITNGGYTVGRSTVSSGNIALTTTNKFIQCSITSADLAGLGGSVAEMFAIAVWLKTGAGNFKLVDHAYVDPSLDFVHTIVTAPRRTAITKTSTELQAATTSAELGSRAPYGCNFAATPTTTGGVDVERTGESVNFTPDTAGNSEAKTTRTANISFKVLAADLKDVVLANAGTYIRTTYNGVDYEEAQMSEYTTAVSVPGSKPLILVMPPDGTGFQPIRLYLGCVLQSQSDNTESYTKDNQIELQYSYNAIPNDTLTNNMYTEVHWKRRA